MHTDASDRKTKQDIDQELEYQARQAQMAAEVRRTPDSVVDRYRHHRHWRLFYKEFVFCSIARFAPKRICDFGCGTGETSTELGRIGYEVVGFDVSPELIEQARRRAALDEVEDKVRFIVSDAASVRLENGQFDLVLAQAVLHHIDLEVGLEMIAALLKPNGVVVIQEPISLSPLLARIRDLVPVSRDISPNERQLSQKDLDQVAARFEVVESRYFLIFGRLRRIVPRFHRVLFWLDHLLLAGLPFLSRFSGTVVMVCRKREGTDVKSH